MKKIVNIFIIVCLIVSAAYISIFVNHEEEMPAQAYEGRLNNDKSKLNDDFHSETPYITVLNHGLGEDASIWSSNEFKFNYDQNSLIEQLRALTQGQYR